jgi:hypothetical protein
MQTPIGTQNHTVGLFWFEGATTLSYTWADLGVTEPEGIGAILFLLSDPCDYSTGTCVSTPYPVNVNIDALQFTR